MKLRQPKPLVITSLLSLVISLVILLTFHAAWGFLITSVLLTAYLLSFNNKILNSFSSRIVISLLVVLVAFQVEGLLFAVLHIQVNAATYSILTSLVDMLLITLLSKRVSFSFPKPARLDIILLIPAIVITGIYTARVIVPKENNSVSIIRSLTLAQDDGTHFSMYDDLLRSNSNLLSFTSDNHSMALQQQSYPMGWHLAASIIANSISPNLKHGSMNAEIISYFFLKDASFLLVIFTFTLFVWQLAFMLIKPRAQKKLSTILGLYFIVAFSTFFTVLPQFFEGFFSFLPIIIYTVLFVILTVDTPFEIKPQERLSTHTVLIASIICSATCWILTFPVLLIAYTFMQVSVMKRIRDLGIAKIITLTICLIIFLLQCFILVKSDGQSFSAISNSGGIMVPDFIFFTLLNVFLVLFTIHRKYTDISKALFVVTLSLYVVMTPILAYISLKSHVITYYFQKLEIIALVVLLPPALVVLYMYIQRLKLSSKQKMNNASLLISFVVLVIMAVPSVIGYTYFVNIVDRIHGYQLSHETATILERSVLNRKFNSSNERYYFYYPDDQASSIFASYLSRVTHFNNTCEALMTNASYGSADTYSITIKKCGHTDSINFVTDKIGRVSLKDSLAKNKVDGVNINFILTD